MSEGDESLVFSLLNRIEFIRGVQIKLFIFYYKGEREERQNYLRLFITVVTSEKELIRLDPYHFREET